MDGEHARRPKPHVDRIINWLERARHNGVGDNARRNYFETSKCVIGIEISDRRRGNDALLLLSKRKEERATRIGGG
jgi:hypothetical protein